MPAQSSMLHVRVDDRLKVQATQKLAEFGPIVSDLVRMLLTRVVKEGALPVGLTADAAAHDAWFRAKVHEALGDTRPAVPHAHVMDDAQALIDKGVERVSSLEWRESARADLLATVDYIAGDDLDATQRLEDDIEAKVFRRLNIQSFTE